MDGATFHQRLRTMLHDRGEAYITPTPEWSDGELTLRAQEARDVVYTNLVDAGAFLSTNRMIAVCAATDGTQTPPDFWRVIIGYKANYKYVLAQPIALSIAMSNSAFGPDTGIDTIWAQGTSGDATHRGVFRGTADFAMYYRTPSDDLSPVGATFTDFSEGVYDAILMLAVIEITQGETQDAADRLDDLYEIYSQMIETFE